MKKKKESVPSVVVEIEVMCAAGYHCPWSSLPRPRGGGLCVSPSGPQQGSVTHSSGAEAVLPEV